MKKHQLQPDGEETYLLNLYSYIRIGHNTCLLNFVSSEITIVTIVFIKIPLSICSSTYQNFQATSQNAPILIIFAGKSTQLGISCEGGERFTSAKLLK